MASRTVTLNVDELICLLEKHHNKHGASLIVGPKSEASSRLHSYGLLEFNAAGRLVTSAAGDSVVDEVLDSVRNLTIEL